VLAALLTIVGYSLNDTVVVFDRVRENLHLRGRKEFDSLVNTSINETLSRRDHRYHHAPGAVA
jgi:preprotein translocase subunit SecF